MKKNYSNKKFLKVTCSALIALVLVVGITFEDLSRKVGLSSLPLPVNTSEEMRASLKEDPAMGSTLYKLAFKFMSVSSLMEEVAKADEERAASTKALADKLLVSIESDSINGVNVYWITPETIASEHQDHLFVNLHGGGYIMGAGMSGNMEAVLIAARSKIKVLAVDYRMPPEHPAPAGLNDVAAVWKHLLKSRPADSMALGGTSAGGGLTLGSIHKFKDLNLELPGAIYAGTPGGDCNKTGDSHYTNEGNDRALISWHGVLRIVCEDLYPGALGAKHP